MPEGQGIFSFGDQEVPMVPVVPLLATIDAATATQGQCNAIFANSAQCWKCFSGTKSWGDTIAEACPRW